MRVFGGAGGSGISVSKNGGGGGEACGRTAEGGAGPGGGNPAGGNKPTENGNGGSGGIVIGAVAAEPGFAYGGGGGGGYDSSDGAAGSQGYIRIQPQGGFYRPPAVSYSASTTTINTAGTGDFTSPFTGDATIKVYGAGAGGGGGNATTSGGGGGGGAYESEVRRFTAGGVYPYTMARAVLLEQRTPMAQMAATRLFKTTREPR